MQVAGLQAVAAAGRLGNGSAGAAEARHDRVGANGQQQQQQQASSSRLSFTSRCYARSLFQGGADLALQVSGPYTCHT